MSIATELEKLMALKAAGSLSEAEFEAAKARLLAGSGEARREEGWTTRFVRDGGPSLLSWMILGLIGIGAAVAVFLWQDEPEPTSQALSAGAVFCLALIASIQNFFEEAPFGAALMVGGVLGVIGLGLVALILASPFILLAIAVLAVVAAILSFFGDLFG